MSIGKKDSKTENRIQQLVEAVMLAIVRRNAGDMSYLKMLKSKRTGQ